MISTTANSNLNLPPFGRYDLQSNSTVSTQYKHEDGDGYLYYSNKYWSIGSNTGEAGEEIYKHDYNACPENIRGKWLIPSEGEQIPLDIDIQCFENKPGIMNIMLNNLIYINNHIKIST